MTSFNINTPLERMTKIISSSSKILSLQQKEEKLKEQISKLKDSQNYLLTKRSLLKESSFNYLISDTTNKKTNNRDIFIETDRKDVVCLLEKENFELKTKLKRTFDLKLKLLKDFVKEFKYEEYFQLDIDYKFFHIINDYISNIEDED